MVLENIHYMNNYNEYHVDLQYVNTCSRIYTILSITYYNRTAIKKSFQNCEPKSFSDAYLSFLLKVSSTKKHS